MKGQQVSHYRLTDKLGAGTYGEVWKGVHVHDDQLFVAVKLVQLSASLSLSGRFGFQVALMVSTSIYGPLCCFSFVP